MIPQVVAFMFAKLTQFTTKRLTNLINQYVLELCTVVDPATLLGILSQECIQHILTTAPALPTQMNRLTCVVGLLKLFALPAVQAQVPPATLAETLATVVVVSASRRVLDLDVEERRGDRSTNLNKVPPPEVHPVNQNALAEVKQLANTVFSAATSNGTPLLGFLNDNDRATLAQVIAH